MKKSPTILIIVGITGDLAKRKLLPAIAEIAAAGVLADDFKILGITRGSGITSESLFTHIKDSTYLTRHLEIFCMDFSQAIDYERLGEKLKNIEDTFGKKAERLFYLSVPPQVGEAIISELGRSGLGKVGVTKLLLEKPFGTDLASARKLIERIDAYFAPEQVYRIDHYLAKEMAQNVIVFRDGNSLFRRTWNNNFIERIEILASEEIGIEGRVNFYENTGALRDVLQSHLLQLAAITLMDLDAQDEETMPERRLMALRDLSVPKGVPLTSLVHRGQYQGYRDEVGNPLSVVETFVSVTLESKNPRWAGVPIILTTGKKLDAKRTEIKIFYKKDLESESNELVLRLQPNEGVSIGLSAKRPGYDKHIDKQTLDFTYAHHYQKLPEAYEQVLLDAMRSDRSLFTTSEEVLESWRIISGIEESWKNSSEDLKMYESGGKAAKVISG